MIFKPTRAQAGAELVGWVGVWLRIGANSGHCVQFYPRLHSWKKGFFFGEPEFFELFSPYFPQHISEFSGAPSSIFWPNPGEDLLISMPKIGFCLIFF